MGSQSGTLTNLKSGPAALTYKSEALGYTLGGSEITITPNTEEVLADEMGSTPIDELIHGANITVTVTLQEFALSKLRKVIPASALVIDGAKEKITGGKAVGTRITDEYGLLTLHPITNGDADVSEDLTIWKAGVVEEITYTETYDAIRTYEVTFKGYADMGRADGDRLYAIGDISASADVTPPSVASIVPADDATAIAISDNVVITLLADDLDEATMDATTVMVIDDVSDLPIAGAYTWASGAKTITFNPTSDLDAATKHRVIVNGLKDVNGNQMTTAFSSNFTTA